MSRKYCDICGEAHDNRGLGLCDEHLAKEEAERNDAAAVEAAQLDHFMSLCEPDRWEKVFDFMRSHDWDAF